MMITCAFPGDQEHDHEMCNDVMADIRIVLESHICDQRRSYRVTFEGPDAETMALAYMESRKSTHVVSEWLDMDDVAICDEWDGEFIRMSQVPSETQTHLVDGTVFPRLYDRLHPTCEHGLSADLCYGPAHYASDYEIRVLGY